jgi:hypothetical protein
MRLPITALSGVIAATTVLAGPALAVQAAPAAGAAHPTVAVATLTHTPTKATFRNTCRTKVATLPSTVQGRPAAFRPGSAKGVYIWHEKAGWRLRVTHPRTVTNGKADLIEVRGRITSTRKLTRVQTVRLEAKQRGEWVSVQRPSRKVLEFRFVNGGFVDGVDFAAGCSGRLGFTVWEVTRAANGMVVRTPMPVFLGSTAMPVTTTSTPALATGAPAGVSRVIVLRTPVSPLP